MNRKEIAAAQKLELDKLAEQEVGEMRREAKQARDRIDSAASAIAARLGVAPPKTETVDPVVPVPATDATVQKTVSAAPASETKAAEPEAPANDAAKTPREATNFADIAANIAGNDWKDL